MYVLVDIEYEIESVFLLCYLFSTNATPPNTPHPTTLFEKKHKHHKQHTYTTHKHTLDTGQTIFTLLRILGSFMVQFFEKFYIKCYMNSDDYKMHWLKLNTKQHTHTRCLLDICRNFYTLIYIYIE